MTINEIIFKFSSGEIPVEDANKELENIGSTIRLNPERNTITEDEYAETSLGLFPPTTVNGYGLMETGTGSLDKVEIRAGRLVNGGIGDMPGAVFVDGVRFEISDDKLVAPEG